MKIIEKIQSAVDSEGYEVAYGEESYGERMFGLIILTKMSERKIGDKDRIAFYRAGDDIKKALHTTSALLDPEGPAMREQYRKEIVDIYKNAGVTAIYMEAIPNGYGGDDPYYVNRPWFRVTSQIGHVVIGWRKRVISINWKDTVVKECGTKLFATEETTRGDAYNDGGGRYVHAWGAAKATQYLRMLHNIHALTMEVKP